MTSQAPPTPTATPNPHDNPDDNPQDSPDTGTNAGPVNREETPGSPKTDNKETRSMAAPRDIARDCPSASAQTHNGPVPSTSSMAPLAEKPTPSTPPSGPSGSQSGPLRSSMLLPLLRCAHCRLLLEAPTTLNCGHTLCSKHIEGASLECPVQGCRPRQPAEVQLIGPNEPIGVTFSPAVPSRAPDMQNRTVKLDVTVSKLLQLVTTTTRQSLASDSDSDSDTIDPRSLRSPAHDLSTQNDPASRASSQSPPRPRKKQRIHVPVHNPTGIPHATSPTSAFEKELLNELTCEICFMLLCNPITTPCQHVSPFSCSEPR